MRNLLAGLAGMSPAYFGLVMATGIVSLAAAQLGHALIARTLYGLNIAAYVVLWLLTALRALRFPRLVATDLSDHLRGPGFFTAVAATSVLGSQALLLSGAERAAGALWALALVLWVVLTYAIFASLTVKARKPPLDQGIGGGWLLAVVATQSIALLGALLVARAGHPHRLELNFVALALWLWGGMLYIWLASLIFYRYTFFAFSPADLSPPYWINMGAMAISTLTGSLLIGNAPDAPFLAALLPFVKGFTLFYWATGTWWIPMLLVLAAWRYLWRRFPMKYDPLYWGAVFPLGMYSASTHEMIDAMGFPFLAFLPPLFLYAALAAWLAAFAGLVRDLVRRIARRDSTSKGTP